MYIHVSRQYIYINNFEVKFLLLRSKSVTVSRNTRVTRIVVKLRVDLPQTSRH